MRSDIKHSFLQVFWGVTSEVLHKTQQGLLDEFTKHSGTLMKNSEIRKGILTEKKKNTGYRYTIAERFYDITYSSDYFELFNLIIGKIKESTVCSNDEQAVSELRIVDEIYSSVTSWFIKARTNSVSRTMMGKVVFASALASLYWLGLEKKQPANEFNDILAKLSADKCRGQDIVFSYDLVSIFVHGTEGIPKIATELKDDIFLLPIYNEESKRALTIPDASCWNEGRTFIEDNMDIVHEIGCEVYEHLKRNKEGMRENDPIVGVYTLESKSSGSEAKCTLYKTDYYTHRVIEKTLQRTGYCCQDYSYYRYSENPTNCWKRTSLGVNIIVRLENSKQIVVAERGALASYGNEGKYYPSVVETIDLKCRRNKNEPDDFNNKYPNAVVAAIIRGLWEELGIHIKDKLYTHDDIVVHSAFHTLDYDQDNFFAVVTVHGMTFDDVNVSIRRAPDFSIENRAIRAISDNPRDILLFILNNRERMISQTIYCLPEYIRCCYT